MRCWDISSGGEFICPSPSAPSWATTPITELAYTGFDIALVAAFALFFLVLGVALIVWSNR